MAYNYEYPYTNMYRHNDDWMINRVKELSLEWLKTQQEWNNTQDEFKSLKTFIQNYFSELDVQDEVNAKLDIMARDGRLSALISPLFDEYQQNINVLSTRMNAFTRLSEGATTGDAETADARIDHTGKEWPNVGEHVRAFESQFSGEVSTVLDGIRTIYESVNKADKSKFVHGEWFDSGIRKDGGENVSHTDFIKVKGGDVIRFKDKSSYFNDYARIDTYTKYKTPTEVFTKYTPKADDDLITYTIPNDKNIGYILVNFATVYTDEFMVTVNEEFPSAYVPYKYDILFVSDKIELKGTLLVTGDSICQGAGTNYDGGYGTILAQKYPKLNVVNYGISGTLITRIDVEGTESIMDRIDRMQDTADFVILEGGVNDGFNGIPLGTYTMTEDAENTNYNIYEFCGAVETMFKKAHTKWKNAVIFCLIPMVVQITQTTTYLDTLKALCKKWGVVPIDIRESGMCVFSQELKNLYTNGASGVGDGLHPNHLGYSKFYVPMIEEALSKYIN